MVRIKLISGLILGLTLLILGGVFGIVLGERLYAQENPEEQPQCLNCVESITDLDATDHITRHIRKNSDGTTTVIEIGKNKETGNLEQRLIDLAPGDPFMVVVTPTAKQTEEWQQAKNNRDLVLAHQRLDETNFLAWLKQEAENSNDRREALVAVSNAMGQADVAWVTWSEKQREIWFDETFLPEMTTYMQMMALNEEKREILYNNLYDILKIVGRDVLDE